MPDCCEMSKLDGSYVSNLITFGFLSKSLSKIQRCSFGCRHNREIQITTFPSIRALAWARSAATFQPIGHAINFGLVDGLSTFKITGLRATGQSHKSLESRSPTGSLAGTSSSPLCTTTLFVRCCVRGATKEGTCYAC